MTNDRSEIYPSLPMPDLVIKVLEMARSGVYRSDAIEALLPCASREEIVEAIRIARKFGLENVRQFEGQGSGGYYKTRCEERMPTLEEVSAVVKGIKYPAQGSKQLSPVQMVSFGCLCFGLTMAICSKIAGRPDIANFGLGASLSAGVTLCVKNNEA
jgi:hypothetical protein